MNDYDEIPIRDKIRELGEGQLFGVLCTQSDEQPYGSMIGFALSDDLRDAVFATPRETRKYRNLTKCQNVALVVNNREKHPYDVMKIQAFTATGKAEEISEYDSQSSWAKMLINKQSYLSEFLESPTTALFRIKIIRYCYVSSFQKVRGWEPE